MGRLHHLSQTLPTNIEWNCGSCAAEFVLLDYSSPDGLERWVKEKLTRHLESGVLMFYQLAARREFHMAHAKNLSHKLSRGTILCNVDADNFTGPNFAQYLQARFTGSLPMFLRSAGPRGSRGRIAFRREQFEALGGYDEGLGRGWGYEDGDLCNRAKAWGLEEQFIPMDSPYLRIIRHGKEESTAFYPEKDRRKSQLRHRAVSRKNLDRGELVANKGKPWGAGHVLRNFTDWIDV